jgi:hypothetical protein
VDVFKNEFKKSLKVVGKTARKILQPREGKSGVTAERVLFAVRLQTQIRDEGVAGKEADCGGNMSGDHCWNVTTS